MLGAGNEAFASVHPSHAARICSLTQAYFIKRGQIRALIAESADDGAAALTTDADVADALLEDRSRRREASPAATLASQD